MDWFYNKEGIFLKYSQKTYRLTLSALFAALCCVMTMVVQIPVPTAGYIHFGDVFVLLSGWLLGLPGVIAVGIGSMFADIFTGYAPYAFVTFLDKAATAAVAWAVWYIRSFENCFPENSLSWD